MSISLEIRARREEGRLVLMQPLVPGPHVRSLFAEESLFRDIDDGQRQLTGTLAYRVGQLRSDFDHFSAGGTTVVGYGTENTCLFKQLDPRAEEVWEIRSRNPKPAIRVFGRFAEADCFIATHWCLRTDLGGPDSREWATEIRRCKAEWKKLFPTYDPHTGTSANDYISRDAIEVSNFP